MKFLKLMSYICILFPCVIFAQEVQVQNEKLIFLQSIAEEIKNIYQIDEDTKKAIGLSFANKISESLQKDYSVYPSLNIEDIPPKEEDPKFSDDINKLKPYLNNDDQNVKLFSYLKTLKKDNEQFTNDLENLKKSICVGQKPHPWCRDFLGNDAFINDVTKFFEIANTSNSDLKFDYSAVDTTYMSDEQDMFHFILTITNKLINKVNDVKDYAGKTILNSKLYEIGYNKQLEIVSNFFEKNNFKNKKLTEADIIRNTPEFKELSDMVDENDKEQMISNFIDWVKTDKSNNETPIKTWMNFNLHRMKKFEKLRGIIANYFNIDTQKISTTNVKNTNVKIENDLRIQRLILKTLFSLFVKHQKNLKNLQKSKIENQAKDIHNKYKGKYALDMIFIESETKDHSEGIASIGDFLVSKSEITVGQYRKCVEAKVCWLPSSLFKISDSDQCNYFTSEERVESSRKWETSQDEYPMNCITWKEAYIYAKWVGGDLPSEQEWQYIARSASLDEKIEFTWEHSGKKEADCTLLNFKGGCGSKSSRPVCYSTSGNTKQGICDLQGNLSEWVKDESNSTTRQAPLEFGPLCEHSDCDTYGKAHKVKGGNWGTQNANDLKISSSASEKYSSRKNYIGFRVIVPINKENNKENKNE